MRKFLIVVSAFLSLSTVLYASIGKIVAVKGEVTVTRDAQVLKAVTGFELEEKDTLISKAKAKAQIIFNDKTVITIGKNSEFSIREYLFDGGTPKASFGITKGAFRAITGKIGKVAPDRFKLQTKTATIGIRGTQILGQINGDDKIACTQGAIRVTSLDTGDSVDVPAGQITTVAPGKPPARPRAYKPAEINRMGSASGGGGETVEADDVIETEGGDEENGDATAEEEGGDDQEEEAAAEEEQQDEEATAEEDQQDETGAEGDKEGDAPTDDGEATPGEGGDAGEPEAAVGDDGIGTDEGGLPEGETDLGGGETFGDDPFLEAEGPVLDDTAPDVFEPEFIPPTVPIPPDWTNPEDDIDKSPLNVIPPVESIYPEFASFASDLYDQSVVIPDSDPYLSWGAWSNTAATDYATMAASDVEAMWVGGEMTPSDVIDGYIVNGASYSYSGGVEGVVRDATSAVKMENGTVNMTFDFASSTNAVTGSIGFDAGSNHWELGVGTSRLDNSGFAIDSFTTGANSDVTIGQGSGTGRFYGSNADSMGGTFGAYNADVTEQAVGAFTGTKQ